MIKQPGFAPSRRVFMTQAAGSLAAVAVLGPGVFSPRQARAAGKPYMVLSLAEVATLEALGETLLPGAAEAGIAHYVDQQLAHDGGLLMLQYLDFPQPPSAFYQSGLAGLEQAAQSLHGLAFAGLSAERRQTLVGQLAAGKIASWQAAPQPLFYFTLRADAIDVCYGTLAGFARLQIPYLAHIAPAAPW